MKGSVLVVDDDNEVRQLLCTMLQLLGYEAWSAIDGVDALQQVQSRLPDAMILDVMMPNMDGLTLCQKLRQEEETSDLPIIMLSGKAQYEDMQAGLKAGATRYLAKPAGMNDLSQNLQDVLSSRLSA